MFMEMKYVRTTKLLKNPETISQLLSSQAVPYLHGMDIDCFFDTKRGWVILEYLRFGKGQHGKIDFYDSDPSRYWKKGWRKFVTLWNLAKDLKARFFLINYEAFENGDVKWGRFGIKRICMGHVPTEDNYIKTTYVRKGIFEDFSEWLNRLDQEVE